MKKLMILAAMMLMSTGAFAQGMFVKPMVGATLSTLTGDVEDTKFRLGLGAGAEAICSASSSAQQLVCCSPCRDVNIKIMSI